MNAGAGRARIQLLDEVSKRFEEAVGKVGKELDEAVGGSSLPDETKAETKALVGLGLSKLRVLALDLRKASDRAKQLEQPGLEEAARRALAALQERQRPFERVRRAWAAALAELRA